MNATVYEAARAKGLTVAESRLLAVYVESQGYKDTAQKLGLSVQTCKNQGNTLRLRLGKCPHIAAAVARVLAD